MTSTRNRGLAPIRTVLPNGAVAIVKATHTSASVAVNLAFSAGSVHDPAGLPGRAYFVSKLLDRGTLNRSADTLAEEFDNRGVALKVAVTRHLTTLTCACLTEDFPAILELIADTAQRPTFPEAEIGQRRAEILTELGQDGDNPAVQASHTLSRLLYGASHPYGSPPKGTQRDVERMTRRDLLAHHRARFAPATMSVVIVGDVDPAAAIDVVGTCFGNWSVEAAQGLPVPPAPAKVSRERLVLPMMNKVQADIAYGFTAVSRLDPEYYACSVMNHIFGQYGLGGRLGENIRERQGMAYYAFSTFEGNVAEGPLVIRAGVSGVNVDRTLSAIDLEVARMVSEGVTDDELDDSCRYLVGSIPRTLETNYGIAKFLQIAEQFDLGSDYDLRLPALYQDVTRDQVNAVARRVLDRERAAMVVAGPYTAAAASPVQNPLLADQSVAS